MKNMSTEKLLKEHDLSTITTYQAGILQASAHRILQKHSDMILKKYGITKMHWLIIGTVLDAGRDGIRLTDLAKTLDTTIAYITVTVNLLCSMQILNRNESTTDSRSKLISINKSFIPTCAEIESTMREALRASLYARVAPKDLRIYIKVLYQLTSLDKTNR